MAIMKDYLPEGITEEAPRGKRNRAVSAPTAPKAPDVDAKKTKVLKGRPTIKAKALVSVMTQDERKQSKAELEDFRLEITPLFMDCVAGILEIKAMSAADAELNADAFAQREDVLAEYLHADEPWRTVAMLVYADAFVRTCGDTKRAVQFTVRSLVDAGFLTDDVSQKGKRAPKDGVRVYDVNYVPTKTFLYRPETRQAMKVLGGLEKRAVAAGFRRMQEEKRQYREDLTALHGMNADPISLEDLLALVEGREASKTEGMIVLRVPDRKVPDNRPGRQGKTRTLQNGHVLFQVAEGSVSAVEGIGRIQAYARTLQASNASIALEQLGRERFKNSSGQRLEDDVFQMMVRLHKTLRQALAAAKQEAERPAQAEAGAAEPTAEVEEYRSRATLTAEAFFGDEPTAGSFVLTHEKLFRVKGTDLKARNIVGLVTRYEDSKIGVECPDRLKPFFGGCQEPTIPGERLERLEEPLRSLLRRARGAARKAAKPEARSDEADVTAADFETGTEAAEQA